MAQVKKEGIIIRGLTLHRPWSYAIACCGKRLENRTWLPFSTLMEPISRSAKWHVDTEWKPTRTILLAIHSGIKLDKGSLERMKMAGHYPSSEDMTPSRIVCVSQLVRVINNDLAGPDDKREHGAWIVPGQLGWILGPPVLVSGFNGITGAQGLWKLDGFAAAERGLLLESSCVIGNRAHLIRSWEQTQA